MRETKFAAAIALLRPAGNRGDFARNFYDLSCLCGASDRGEGDDIQGRLTEFSGVDVDWREAYKAYCESYDRLGGEITVEYIRDRLVSLQRQPVVYSGGGALGSSQSLADFLDLGAKPLSGRRLCKYARGMDERPNRSLPKQNL